MRYYKRFNYATRLRSRNYIRRRRAYKAYRAKSMDNNPNYVNLVPRHKRQWFDTHTQGFHFPPEYNVEAAESKSPEKLDWAESFLRNHPKLTDKIIKVMDKFDENVIGPTANKLIGVPYEIKKLFKSPSRSPIKKKIKKEKFN